MLISRISGLVALLLSCSCAQAWVHGAGAPAADVTCMFTTGNCTGTGGGSSLFTAATCNGSVDDTPAFDSFLNWANNTWQPSHTGLIELVIPAGKNCSPQTNTAVLPPLQGSGAWITYGVKQLRITGSGATLTTAGVVYELGSGGICHRGIADTNGCSARINTVSAGSQSVTLTSGSFGSGYISRFTVGQYAVITGYDLQGGPPQGGGYPPNPHYFDYVKITAVNIGTGAITFDVPLRYKYESTWPLYYAGTAFEADAGGPATIYALDPKWETTLDIRGLILNSSSQINNNGRSITYHNVSFTGGGGCAIPSQNDTWSAINSDFSNCSMEADKIIGTVTFSGTTISGLGFQSSSIDNLFFINSTATSFINGTPKFASISGSTVASFKPGAFAYGRSDEVICTNSTIGAFSNLGILEKGPSDAGVNAGFTMSGGVISIPATYNNLARWAVPGTNLFWAGAFDSETVFQSLDATCSGDCTFGGGGNILVTTSLAGGFPGVPLTSGKLYIQVHPAPKFTSTNCAGLEYLQGGVAQAPLYSYSTVTLSGTGLGTTSNITAGHQIWGVPTSLNWNVTAAYTGAGSLTLQGLAAFGNYPTVDTVTYASSTYAPTINLKQTGSRVAAPGGVTCNGGAGSCSGDTLSAPSATGWFASTFTLAASADISGSCSSSPSAGCPTVAITLQTNQGVVYP